MPKSQAGWWNDNKQFVFERNNSNIKIRGKIDTASNFKAKIITPKRLEIKEDEYSSGSQAPTPVPEYRK